MNPTREDVLFAAALELPAAERAVFLDGACLNPLLAAHKRSTNDIGTVGAVIAILALLLTAIATFRETRKP